MRYSQHFKDMMKERGIETSWVNITVGEPEEKEIDGDGNTHYIRKIPQFGNRFLRVIINETVQPYEAVTTFFDRRLRRKK